MGSFAMPHYNGNALASVSTIKASAGQLTMLDAKNENVTGAWLQIFDHASPTVGTTVPTFSFWVPPGGGVDKMFHVPVEFASAIKYAWPEDNVLPALQSLVYTGLRLCELASCIGSAKGLLNTHERISPPAGGASAAGPS